MPAKDGFHLTDDDIEILRFVHEVRLAHIGHIVALTGRSEKAIARRLSKLEERRYLSCRKRPPQKHLYWVGGEGLPVLVEAGFAPEEVLSRRPRESELKDLWLRHFLLVVDIHVKLILETREGSIQLLKWTEGSLLFDRVTVRDERGRQVIIPIRPDAAFVLRSIALPEGKNTAFFFLEADRSTMSHGRIESKMRGYFHYYQQRGYQRKFPELKVFQVLTVTETPARAASLASAMQDVIPQSVRRAYRFLPLVDVSAAAIFPTTAAPSTAP